MKQMANLTRDDIREVIETIKGLYLEDMIPWICGYSGGKDSTAVVQLVWMALSELPKDKLKKTVHVISTDTIGRIAGCCNLGYRINSKNDRASKSS